MAAMQLKPSASNAKIDRAGAWLREWWASGMPEDEYGQDAEADAEIDVLWDYRACFAEPLRKTIMGFRYMVQAESGAIGGLRQVTQRLKRLPAIINKLDRYPSMRLTQMQDIGGCRAVLPGGPDEVDRVRRRVSKRWEIVDVDDYVASPQPDTGYRAVHLIVERDGRLIEIQLRTLVQQNWAEQVERSQRILGQDLKDGKGPERVLKYYELLSHGMAIAERGGEVDRELVERLELMGAEVHGLISASRGS